MHAKPRRVVDLRTRCSNLTKSRSLGDIKSQAQPSTGVAALKGSRSPSSGVQLEPLDGVLRNCDNDTSRGTCPAAARTVEVTSIFGAAAKVSFHTQSGTSAKKPTPVEGQADAQRGSAATVKLAEHWAQSRQQTRDEALEQGIQRRQEKGCWCLAAGEGLDWQHIRNEFYTAMPESFGEVSVDDCIDAFLASREGLRLLDLGCGVGALLARLRRDICGEKMDWSSTFGVTSVHNFDVSMFTPPAGFPDFFETQLLRFNLDFLAAHAETDLASKRFDLIISHYCWCHLQDPLGALICAFGLLSAGGVLMFIEPLHAPSNSLPYTDHRLYHTSDDGIIKPLSMRQLLQHWQQEVAIFSALERGQGGGERKHVLALRKHAEHQQLSLPVSVCPGNCNGWTLPNVREERLRRGDQEAFVTPSARNFPDWLQKAKTQRLQRVAV